jgi:hypothetical protein
MRELQGEHQAVEVDPAVLRQASNVLFDSSTALRVCANELQAEAAQAARAFDGWRTGASLMTLGDSWKRHLDADADESSRLCNSIAAAESHYWAADAKANTRITTVDDHYFHGR